MAKRIMWDKYEAVILHEAAISVHTKKESRTKIVKQVSDNLRLMATNRGIQIDDVYRNANGVSMQLRGMEATIYDIDCKLKAHSKLFVEIAQLYNNDRSEYEAILNTAHQMIWNQDKEVSTVDMINEKSKSFNDIVALLKKKYKFGFRFNSAIEIIRFRQFAEMEGIVLPEEDGALKDEIQKAGFVVEDRVYVIDDEIAQEFIDIINDIANQGYCVVFYEALQECLAEWLTEHHIVSLDVLKELLSHNSDQFYIGRNFMTFGQRITEVEAVVHELKRIWGENTLLDFSAMSNRLPMIPLNRIKHAISYSTDFVWNSEETYAFLDRVIISEAEKDAIIEFVQNKCENAGYASLSDIPMGAIAEVNYALSNTALYNAIYNKVLLGNFYLNGKILTATESTISAISLVKAYCSNKNECTFDELADRVVELTGGTNRQYAFEAAYDTMVRVDMNRFVADQYVSFEIDTIDALLDELVADDFISIKGIATFALFPFCGQSWNHYLLESFCYRFSKKYRLQVMNFNDKNAGIISKKSCRLNYKEMLAIAISQADIPLTTESAGAYLFASGYMAKRKYGNMDTIVQRAKELRERND